MSTINCTRRFQFCAGHRVLNHESKCRNMHGHNYVLKATAIPHFNELDDLGRVIDFSVIKDVLGTWLDRYWDHGFIVFQDDDEVKKTLLNIKGQKIYVMPTNPTAENMAIYLIEKICPELFKNHDVDIVTISIDETENCNATVSIG